MKKNPILGGNIIQAAKEFIDMHDSNFFTKEVTTTEIALVSMLKERFKEEDMIKEIRMYKAESLIFGILKIFADTGMVNLNIDPPPAIIPTKLSRKEQIKEEVNRVFENFKNKKK